MGLEVPLFGVTFRNPVLLAAGTCGFGREVAAVTRLEALGGLVTKSITLLPRAGNPPPRVAEFEAGMLNSVGLANPGAAVVRTERLPWIDAHLPALHVFVSVAGHTTEEYLEVVRTLEDGPGFLGFELNLSCPNDSERDGLPFALDPEALGRVVAGVRVLTPRPLLVKLAPNTPDFAPVVRAAEEAGADGLTLVNTAPGLILEPRSGRPRLGSGQGGRERAGATPSRPRRPPDGPRPHGASAHRCRGDRPRARRRLLPRAGRIARAGGYGLLLGSARG